MTAPSPLRTAVRDKFYSLNNRPKIAKKVANYPSPSGEVAVVAEGRGLQMRVRVEQKTIKCIYISYKSYIFRGVELTD